MKKSNIVLITISILMIVMSAITITFAWFSIVEKTQNILIYSGKVKLEAVLYKDSVSESNKINSININNVVPGDSNNYILEIESLGNIMSDLTVIYTFKSNNEALKNKTNFRITEVEKYKKIEGIYIKDNEFDGNGININVNILENLKYTYQNNVDEKEKILVYFSLSLLNSFEISDLLGSNDDYISIDSIVISLEQSEINGD